MHVKQITHTKTHQNINLKQLFNNKKTTKRGWGWGGNQEGGGDAEVYVFDINQLSLPTPFSSVFVSVSVFLTLSTVFRSINSPDNSLLSDPVLPILFLPYWSFQQYISF